MELYLQVLNLAEKCSPTFLLLHSHHGFVIVMTIKYQPLVSQSSYFHLKNIKPNTIYPALYLSCIHIYIYLYIQFFLFIPLVNLGQQMTGLFASHRGPLLCLEVSSSIELKLLTIPLYPHTCGYPTQCVQSHLERADRPRLFRRRHPGIYRVEITGCGLAP